MRDLIERLQRWGRTQKLECVPPEKLMREAADEIAALEEQVGQHVLYYSELEKTNADLQAKLEAFEKSRRKYRNALSELEKDHE